MSKYQPRIFSNNPEKNTPDDVTDQFFLAIKSADVDRIRDFSNTFKNKYNLIERGGKTGTSKTPFHIVLELDEKVADNDTKLRIMRYLDQMGAPMDLPDTTDVWPIHLAAALQSEEILNFFIKRKVNIDRKDSSNNTPLHYAINGRETTCPKSSGIKDLVPAQKIDKLPLNKSLTNINNKIINLLNANSDMNSMLIHMINTIDNIPKMYIDSKVEKLLQSDIINIFTDIASNPSFASDPSDIAGISRPGGMTAQQTKIEQLIEKTYTTINDELLRGLTSAIDISPNNTGWGPNIPSGPPPSAPIPPNNLQRIMPSTTAEMMLQVENEYRTARNTLGSINDTITDKIARSDIPRIESAINQNYLEMLVFCQNCGTTTDDTGRRITNPVYNGQKVTLTKMLYLMIAAYHKFNYASFFAGKVLENFGLMSKISHDQILTNTYQPNFNWATDQDRDKYLFMVTPTRLFNSTVLNSNQIDKKIGNLFGLYGSNCINDELRRAFTDTDDPAFVNAGFPHDEFNDVLGSVALNDLLKRTEYVHFRPLVSSLRPIYASSIDASVTWFVMLDMLIYEIWPQNPVQPDTTNNIFTDLNPILYIGGYRQLPMTPFSSMNPTRDVNLHTKSQYTFNDMFRMMNAIEKFLSRGNFQIRDAPDIYMSGPIYYWNSYIDNVASTPIFGQIYTIGQTYPEFIFLYRILAERVQRYIREIIERCVNAIINRTVADRTSPATQNMQFIKDYYNTPVDDMHMMDLLLPPFPDINAFVDPSFDDLKNNKWVTDHALMTFYGKIKESIPDPVVDAVLDAIYPVVDAVLDVKIFNYNNLNRLRELIESSVAKQPLQPISVIIDNAEFKREVLTYFRNNNTITRYNLITRTIPIDDAFDTNIADLATGNITDLFFLTNVHGYFIVIIKQLILQVQTYINQANNIVSDIIMFMDNQLYYYVPQIFLPALVKQLIKVVSTLLDIRNQIELFNQRKTNFNSYINISKEDNLAIISLGDRFIRYINPQLNILYDSTLKIMTYHNNVIEFINHTSALQLMRSTPTVVANPDGTRSASNVFTLNLLPLDFVANTFSDIPNLESFLSIIRQYSIPEIVYHGAVNPANRALYTAFVSDSAYQFDSYRDIIDYDRLSTMPSMTPALGDNMQLNLTAADDPANPGNPIYSVIDTPFAIAGPWLDFQLDQQLQAYDPNNPPFVYDPNETKFSDAFIRYQSANYTFEWLEGMTPSIKKLLGSHLKILKQEVIQRVIQYIIDNKYLGQGNPAQNQDLVKMYDDIRRLGNETTYTNIDDVKIHVIIGKITDATINKLMDYTIRQSISSWVLGYATRDNRYRSIANVIQKTVDIIRQKDYLKISLNNIDSDAINDLLAINPKYIDYKLTQIEPNPNAIEYTSKPLSTNFIHYLYKINYFSTSNLSSDAVCYQINPAIASKLISNSTINSKNSDGNTPLHMAINMLHPELVELLISRGANPKGFTNIHGQTAYDVGLTAMTQHINFTDSNSTVIGSINNFVIPFNDLLMSRLKDEKYGNNIVKGISLGIPIMLTIYNHMFHLYLENYRYDMSYQLKQSITAILQKYHQQQDSIFPIDLFQINNNKQLASIINIDFPAQRAETITNTANSRKISKYRQEISRINIQLNGLIQDRIANQPNVDDELEALITQLESRRTFLDAKITSLELVMPDDPQLDMYMTLYKSTVKSIGERISRGADLVEFYRIAFGRIGQNHQMYQAIWDNYLNKNLSSAPSMIFSLLNNDINRIVNLSRANLVNAEVKSELRTITDFYKLVAKYIQSKNPNGSLDDDPMLSQEFSQIVYLINLILSPAIRNILLSQIYQGLREMDGANTIIRDQTAFFDEITRLEFNGHTLDSYLYDVLPQLATKFYTGTYSNSEDSDRQITSSGDLFMPFIFIVKSNKIIQVTDESTLIKNMREYLIPFISNTYQNFIYHIRLAIYGYERYILNTYQLLRIMQSLI